MQRRRLVVGLGALVVVVVALVLWKQRGGGGVAGEATPGAAVAAAKATEPRTRAPRDRSTLAPAQLSGRVTRASDGSGIAGAVVSLAEGELLPKFIKTHDAPTQIVIADANGAWTAPRVVPGSYRVAATAKGFLPGDLPKLVIGEGEHKGDVDLVLTAGGTLVSGTVTDVGGGPIADARVTATRSGVRELEVQPDLVATTGPDGTYELTLPDGELELTATHEDYASVEHAVELAGEPRTVDFSLIPGAVIRGQVIARDSGEPVPGAIVRAEGEWRAGSGGNDAMITSDEQGTFTVRGLPSGEVELHALGRGFASASPTIVSVGVGEQLEGVRVLVDRAYSISGRTVRKGKPDEGLPGITMGAFSIANKTFGVAPVPTDRDGAFEIIGLRPASYMLFAFGEGTVPEVGKNVEIIDRDLEGVIVEMATGVTIAGRVEPTAEGVAISVEPGQPIGLANMFEAVKAILIHAETDATGAFVLRNVPAGAFKLVARARGGSAGTLALMVGETDQRGVVIKLEPRGTIAGKVVDTSGKPVAGTAVRAQRKDVEAGNFSFGGDRDDDATTRADGTFEIRGLDAGKYEVRANDGETMWWASGGDKRGDVKSVAEVELAAAAHRTGVVLTIEARDGVIRGVVLGADRKPAADAWVTASREMELPSRVSGKLARYASARAPVLTNADGQFTIGKLRKGTYRLAVEGPRGGSRAEKIGVKMGESVTIQLLALGSLSGRVTLGGTPVAAYEIECEGADKDVERRIDASDGAYTLERMAPGSYACSVTSDAGKGSGKVDVGSEPAKLDIALTRWASVSGVVVDVLAKKPVPGLLVMSGMMGSSSAQVEELFTGRSPTTGPDGRFTLPRVEVGKGTVTLMPKTGFTPLGSREYTVTEGQRVDLGTIEVVPPRTGEAGTFGLGTEITDDKLLVTAVTDGGPAQAAGVQAGDRIIAINGREVTALTPMIAKLLLSSGTVGVGQQVVLTLDRAGSPVTASLASVKW